MKEKIEINAELQFNTAENIGTMTFSPRVKLVIYFNTGNVYVLIDNEVKSTYENVTIPELMRIEEQVQQAANLLN